MNVATRLLGIVVLGFQICFFSGVQNEVDKNDFTKEGK